MYRRSYTFILAFLLLFDTAVHCDFAELHLYEIALYPNTFL